MKNILFPTDFSNATEKAKSFAIEMALKNKAKLFMVNIYQMPQVGSGSFSSGLLEVIKKDSIAKMADLELETSKNFPNLSVQYKCILGDPITVINDIAEENKMDMIVMGTHGASGIESVLMGSNTQSVIKNAKTSVMAIPTNVDFSNFKNFALATDLVFEKTSNALNMIKTICESYNTNLKLIHFTDFLDDTEEKEEKLHEVFKEVEHEYIERMTNDIDKGLSEFIEYEKINLLMMIHRKHGFWENLFTTSHSEKRALQTKIPLLVLKEDE